MNIGVTVHGIGASHRPVAVGGLWAIVRLERAPHLLAACGVAKLVEIRLVAAGILQRPLMRATANEAVAYRTCARDSEAYEC